MISKHFTIVLVGISVLIPAASAISRANAEGDSADASRPNVVIILTDNHGAWTLGCYGNPDIRTPHIDRLARQGTLFTRAFANNPVCSPTRASLLTGLMPSQHGVHCFLFSGRLQTGPEARCTLDEFQSLPEILRDAGYSCGLVGKWHLGGNMEPQEGFDDYWITMPHGATSTFYNAPIIENGKIRREPTYLTDFWTEHACRFIRRRSRERRPFFLFLSYNGPYALGRLLLQPGKNRHAQHYADSPLHSFPREQIHPWQYNNRDYINNPVSIRRVATEVSGIDDGVGKVLETLKQTGAADNTLIIFLADQGWVGGHGGFFGMGDHTRPFTARDGMMRIPMIWWQPGRIHPQRHDLMVSNVDVMPTLLSHLGLKSKRLSQNSMPQATHPRPKSSAAGFVTGSKTLSQNSMPQATRPRPKSGAAGFVTGSKMPESPRSPGRDFSPVLRGESVSPWRSEVFFEFESLRCIRTDRWKLVRRFPEGPDELYDLKRDPDEENNLIETPLAAEVRGKLAERLDQFFDEYSVARYDLWHGGGSQTRLLGGIDSAAATSATATPPPLPKDFVRPEIRVPEGFQVELAAGPPLVQHPTMATVDDRGRLFVCENAGVNLSAQELEKQLPNSIRLLTDKDGDGRYDSMTVFADKMTFPMGAVWYRGALYVASPPYIWKLEDTDDDGVADRRTILVRKFGYTGNAASIHGCFLGPDGRLYWCDGYHGHEFDKNDGKTKVTREGSYLFSCLPDGSDVRIHCGGGMDNPVEVDFLPGGEMLGTVNILYTRPRVDCMVHWLYGGTYPHRERVLAERQVTGDFLGPMYRFGHVAVSGTTRYRSGLLDRRWRDDFFVTFFNSGQVVRLDVARSGSTFAGEQFEFLSSSSRDFHPTDVLEDGDGSLLVVDTGGWFYRGCPTSQLAKPDIKGAIYRVRRRGAPRQIDPYGRRIEWNALTVAQAISLLGDTRHRVRNRAIETVADHGPAAIPALSRALRTRDRPWRLGSVWALCRIANDRAGDAPTTGKVLNALAPALGDRDLDVRLAALHVFALHPRAASLESLLALLHDASPAVRRAAAVAIGRIGEPRAVAALLSAVRHSVDRAEEHAAIYALLEINDPLATSSGLKSPSPRTRRAALIALDQQTHPRAEKLLTLPRLLSSMESGDPSLAAAALDILNRRRSNFDTRAVVAKLQEWLSQKTGRHPPDELLKQFLATWLSDAQIADWVGRRLSDSATSPEQRELLLSAMAQRRTTPLAPTLTKPLSTLLQSDDPAVRASAVRALIGVRQADLRRQLERLALDEDEPAELRVAAVEALASGAARLSDAAFEWILGFLEEGSVPTLRLRLVQVLGRASLTDDQLLELTGPLEEAGPLELRELIRPYQRTRSPQVGTAFLESLESARALDSLSENELSPVIIRYPKSLLPRANKLLDRLRGLQQQKADSVSRFVALLEKADVDAGRKVFFSEKAKCSTCHRVGKEGKQIGPDLTTIGSNRSAQDLIESILFPSATIVRQYEPYVVRLLDGRVLNGLITRETQDAIVLQPQTGDPVTIRRDEIDALQMSTVSIMPAGLEKELSARQLADVVRFLLSCRAESSGTPTPTATSQ